MVCKDCHGKIHELYSTLVPYVVENTDHVTSVDSREHIDRKEELSDVLDEPIFEAVRKSVSKNDGVIERALEDLNSRLREVNGYDHDERGLVSKPTFYNWCDEAGV